MLHYVTLLRYTQQGASKIKESPARLDAAKEAAKAQKGKIHGWYLTMGKYDAVLISEFPDDETAARFMLATGGMSNVSTQTLKAFTEAEYRKIVASLPWKQNTDSGDETDSYELSVHRYLKKASERIVPLFTAMRTCHRYSRINVCVISTPTDLGEAKAR